ncbi:ribosomal protein L11 methyltransferase [Methylomarinovum caldicuralii]|uniref:Ribosomal protein L11 methyltransferase n=1 Tax=Methylomarinovum caldicuralii TaxID=438856 RepID=A0AAU9BPN6_9GAMM|nr:50S ribosomal protein L11 methyltransferase [Methylomarinovum caldicuralii]BCX80673.1 ribosomal protein L11 methyltransferase [Methylomarinovum caldicuralii]
MAWRQLSFTLPQALADEVSDRLDLLGAQAVTFSEGGDEELFEPLPGETPLWQQTRATALFDPDTDTHAIADQLQAEFPQLQDWLHETLADQPWERAWLEHFQPLNFGRLWVCPSGQTPPDPDAVCLTLDPGLAFGTGTHPTTALCLEWLAEAPLAGKTVIDYGCGSGILAIAALLLGAERAVACDIDPQALSATYDNALKNRVADRLHCCDPERMPGEAADIVIANILAGPLVELAPRLTALTRSGGRLVLSGLLESQLPAVRQAYREHFDFDVPAVLEGWGRLHGLKY